MPSDSLLGLSQFALLLPPLFQHQTSAPDAVVSSAKLHLNKECICSFSCKDGSGAVSFIPSSQILCSVLQTALSCQLRIYFSISFNLSSALTFPLPPGSFLTYSPANLHLTSMKVKDSINEFGEYAL